MRIFYDIRKDREVQECYRPESPRMPYAAGVFRIWKGFIDSYRTPSVPEEKAARRDDSAVYKAKHLVVVK